MANIQNLLNDEIRRLARKELNATVKDLKAQLVDLRKTAAEQNRRIKELEKNLAAAGAEKAVNAKNDTPAAEKDEKSFRITPQRIRKWREKLGLSQQQYAALLEVNSLSVCHWEAGKTTPRDAQKQRISLLRDMKKRDLKKLFAEKNIKVKESKTAKKAAKKSVQTAEIKEMPKTEEAPAAV